MPPSAGEEIRAAIAAAGGAIPFETFMRLALYGESGFYATVGSAGRRGDFITSPEVGPLFGRVVAAALDGWWRELGEPPRFTMVDAGAGPGTLARSIRAAQPACLDALDYIAVEIADTQRERHPEWVTSTASMPDHIDCGIILANELLDNLPFRLFVMDGGWREAFVVDDGADGFVEVLLPADELPQLGLPADAAHGARIPVQQVAGDWLRRTVASLGRGTVVIVDYAVPTTAALAARPWREWLRTFRGHDRGEHYLRRPGTQDITSDVAIDQLIAAAGEPTAVRSQAQFLQRWGIDALVEEGRRSWSERSPAPDVAAMTMRSRVREAEALLDVGGLGSFTVLEFTTRTRVKET